MGARHHSGQALVVVLAFTAAMLGGFVLVFNSGQSVNEKARMVNAADAAAYSAALWEARALNFQSYMNRAIVANEVAIAQFVTLRSWSRYMEQNIRNVSVVTAWIPGIREALQALDKLWTGIDRVLQRTSPVAETALSHWNVNALAFAQVLAHQQAPITAGEIASEVARANRPDADLSTGARMFALVNGTHWLNSITAKYRHGESELARFKDVVMRSRDGFTAQRNWNPVSLGVVGARKRGGTDLIGEYSWRGMDTLAAHVDLGVTRQEIPLAWNAAENRHHPQTGRGVHGGSFRTNPRTSRLAQRTFVPASGYLGLPEIRDIDQPALQKDLRLRYVVELREAAEHIATADRALPQVAIALPDGRAIDPAPHWQQDSMFAVSAAEIYFRRPVERADGRREFPSLFNPYWQVHLASVEGADRALAAPTKGLAVDPYAVLP
ncbi:MAG: pilus assembly protein TadG-related protein [Steroidobacteraceae bacterium]